MESWRGDLPPGPVGESWDLSDHPRGMSVVDDGPWRGTTLRDLMERHGRDVVGGSYRGGDFPLLVKLIDARDRLSVQVHPDDAIARAMGVGPRGKTECWMMIADGGELFVGTRPGCTRERFARALAAGRVADQLNRYQCRDGDFFLLAARTVHALGAGCLLYEVQQTSDVTFRVDDWGRVGLDGRPRPLHISESLETIDFNAGATAAVVAPFAEHPAGGAVRRLADGAYFSVEERRARHTRGGGDGVCSIVVCLAGAGTLATAAGGVALRPMRTYLIPAIAGAWSATAAEPAFTGRLPSLQELDGLRLLVAKPAWKDG